MFAAVSCGSFEVANSNTTGNAQSGSTTDTVIVECTDGHVSSAGNSFVVSCLSTGAITSSWSNVLTCDEGGDILDSEL